MRGDAANHGRVLSVGCGAVLHARHGTSAKH
jgi:hypothetical protein